MSLSSVFSLITENLSLNTVLKAAGYENFVSIHARCQIYIDV